MEQTKLLIVEDEVLIAEGLKELLIGFGYQVCAVINSGKQALSAVEKHHPDLILMDIQLGEALDGIAITKKIQNQFNIPIIYLTAFADEATLERAKETIPYGYLVKPVQDQELNATVKMALHRFADQQKLSPSLSLNQISQHIEEKIETVVKRHLLKPDTGDNLIHLLTNREKEILSLVVKGQNNKEIAEQLQISILTVKTHKQNLMSKLDIHDISKLIHFGMSHLSVS